MIAKYWYLRKKNVETIIAISKLEIFSAVVRLGCYFFSHGSSKSLSFHQTTKHHLCPIGLSISTIEISDHLRN